MSATYERILQFLADPGSYPFGPSSVRLVHTHISVVALAGPYVFKVKKPVDLGFLDFTTLERRRFFCEREVELNARLCTGIYEGVVPIVEDGDGHLHFEGEGRVVEFCVKMRQIPPEAFLKKNLIAAADNADASRKLFPMDRLVDRLSSFYLSRVPVRFDDAAYLSAIFKPMDENFPPYVSYHPDVLPPATQQLLQEFFRLAQEVRLPLLLERMHDGQVGDHHGDLHLEHIVVSPDSGDVCIFDCIEFNDSFRLIDRSSDLAFLCMDLDFHGCRLISADFLKRMSDRFSVRDRNGFFETQDLFRAYRACVRGKVHTLMAGLPTDSGVESAEAGPEGSPIRDPCTVGEDRNSVLSRSYFQLALRYAVCGIEPLIIIAVGRVGSGKSALSRTIGAWLGVQPSSSDSIRKTMFGIPILEATPGEWKPRVYAPEASEETYRMLIERGIRDAISAGVAILDATFSSPQKRKEAIQQMNAAGTRFVFVEVTARDVIRRQRLEWRNRRPNQSDARLEDLQMLDERYSPPDEIANIVRVDSSDGSKEDTAGRTLRRLIRDRLNA